MPANASTILRAALVADGGVTALIGTRIYPNEAGRTASLPYAVYQTVTRDNQDNFTATPTLWFSTVQLDLYAATYAGVIALKQACEVALQGAKPTGSAGIVLLNEQDGFSDDTKIHRVIQDWRVAVCV